MKLMEAFGMKNKFRGWIDEALDQLEKDTIIYEITEEHRRGDVYPDEKNYIVTRNTSRQMDANILLRLVDALYDEHNRLEGIIWHLCEREEIHLEYDAGIYQDYRKVLEVLGQLKNMEEKISYETQQGYKVNSKGKQIPYECHIRKTFIPDFDQDKIAAMYDEIFRKFMEKRYIGEALENDEVPFESVFSRFDSLEDVYHIFQAQLQAG